MGGCFNLCVWDCVDVLVGRVLNIFVPCFIGTVCLIIILTRILLFRILFVFLNGICLWELVMPYDDIMKFDEHFNVLVNE